VSVQLPSSGNRAAYGLPRTVHSLCPQCLLSIPATLLDRDGEVWMEKSCPLHGPVEDKVASRTDLFLRLERLSLEDPVALEQVPGGDPAACPKGCGLCTDHQSSASMTNLDLTNRCNLRCPFCFANAAVQPYVYEPSLEQIRGMLERALAVRPKRLQAIQFSGGEPTLSPHFLEACGLARDAGIRLVQAATNGIRFAREPGFARAAAAAGLNGVYLQFDGVDDEVYRTTRGVSGLWELKLRALEALRDAGIRVTLVPTVIRGVNDHQVGDILKFAVAHMDCVIAVAFQPVAFTGRVEAAERHARRYTLTDLATDLEAQTGLFGAMADWFPLSVVTPFTSVVENVTGADASGFHPLHCNTHAGCGLSAYLLVNEATGASVPLSRVFDTAEVLRLTAELARSTGEFPSRLFGTAGFLRILLKTFRPEHAPEGLTLFQLAKTIDALSGHRMMAITRRHRYPWRLLFVTSMHFQDAYNYQADRVRRCTIHYSAPDGHIYPFCSYNAGACFREPVERAHGVPREEWLRSRGAAFVTEGFEA